MKGVKLNHGEQVAITLAMPPSTSYGNGLGGVVREHRRCASLRTSSVSLVLKYGGIRIGVGLAAAADTFKFFPGLSVVPAYGVKSGAFMVGMRHVTSR